MGPVKKEGFGSLQETETDSVTSATDVFEHELVETSVIHRKGCIIRPNAISNTGPLHINIPPEGDYYIHAASFRVHADFKIKKWDTTTNAYVDLVDADATKVAPVNLLGKSIFKDVETYIQQKQITLVATAMYPVKAYLETIASFGTDAKNGHLRCSYFAMDKPGKYDSPADNTTFAERHKYIAKSRSVKIAELMHTEITTMNRYLLPGIDISFIFSLNDPGFFLQTTDDAKYQLQFSDFYLSFDRIAISPSINTSIEKKLASNTKAIYMINRGTIRSKQIPANEQNALWQSMYVGTLPESVTICLIDSKAFNGNQKMNIFNFQHFDMESIVLRVNSSSIPAQPLLCDFKNKEAIRAYRHFFDNIGINHTNNPCLIKYEDFLEGATIIPFDLTPDKCALYHAHKKETGTIELDIKFSTPLPSGITVLALCNYSDRLYISGPYNNREVFLNPNLTS